MTTPFRLALVLTATALLAGPAFSLTLDELIEKYGAATAALTEQHRSKLQPDADSYLAELDTALVEAKRGASTLVTSAIERERKVVQQIGELPKDAPADLPRQIESARRKYVRAVSQAAKDLASGEDDLKERFTRGLDSLERQANIEKDEALLVRIAAERAKLAGAPDTDKGFGKNLLKNAGFTAGPTGPGVPPEWDNHDGKASVEKEEGKAFLYLQGKGLSQLVKLPEGTRKIQAALRLRAPDLKALDLPGSHKAGVHLYLEDAAGKLIKSSDIEITRKERKWREFSTDVSVPDGVAQVRLMIFREGIEGGLHADSVSLMAFER